MARRKTRRCSPWSNLELNRLRVLFPHATDKELEAAFPGHTLRAIRSRAYSLGVRRSTLIRPHIRQRQIDRMERAGAYLTRRVAELGALSFARAAQSPAELLAVDCLIAAAQAISARKSDASSQRA
jgi:hypothetical protein